MEMSGTVLLLLVFLVVIVLFLVGGCNLSCSQKSGFTKGSQENLIEGYKRSCLGGDCYGLQRTPVDYAMKYPDGWQRNPHYRAQPSNEHQPLDFGPIDFWPEERKLNKNNGVLFQQYGPFWKGCGRQNVFLANDSKNRFDLMNIGDYGARSQLDDLYNPRFGKAGYQNTERNYNEPNPFYNKIYGGRSYLTYDKLGDFPQ